MKKWLKTKKGENVQVGSVVTVDGEYVKIHEIQWDNPTIIGMAVKRQNKHDEGIRIFSSREIEN